MWDVCQSLHRAARCGMVWSRLDEEAGKRAAVLGVQPRGAQVSVVVVVIYIGTLMSGCTMPAYALYG